MAYAQNNTPLADSNNKKPSYKMGVFPNIPALRLAEVFAPIVNELSAKMGADVRYKSSSTFLKFMDRLEKQEYDIAFIQPFDYVRIAEKNDYLPLVAREEDLSAILVVKEGSSLKTLSDLKGKTIAFPPKVAAVTYLVKIALLDAGVMPDDVTFKYTKTHSNCMRNVLLNKADACGTAPPPRRHFEFKSKTTFKLIHSTPPIPHALFVVHTRVPEAVRAQIKSILLRNDYYSEAGKKLLRKLTPVVSEDYEVVREYWKRIQR